ncbi:MAG TPA: hypothetical protein VJ992_01600 [Gemmatimonadales bacterium]|jgi:hypothetical protein|nr:hypothetical protein [Gemmatimonadales bacterium]
MGTPDEEPGYLPIADLSIETVRPLPHGFALEGRGVDGADYRLEMDLELPVDRRTRTVLAELLAQSDWRVARRAPPPLLRRTRRTARVPR